MLIFQKYFHWFYFPDVVNLIMANIPIIYHPEAATRGVL